MASFDEPRDLRRAVVKPPFLMSPRKLDPNLLFDMLSLAPSSIQYSMSRFLHELEAQRRAVLEVPNGFFDLNAYAKEGGCTLRDRPGIHSEYAHLWWPPGEPLRRHLASGWVEVDWQGHVLEVVQLVWSAQGHGSDSCSWVICDDAGVAEAFIDAVCTWNYESHEEVLVYVDGCWEKSDELYQAIRRASLDDLVLADGLEEIILSDLERFLAAQELYQEYGVPWKRGLIFMGPPGNGKTFTLMGLIGRLNLPALYVRAVTAQYSTEEGNIREVFERARKSAPCLLIFEDMDALITDENRSFFLNELDGFAENQGLITIATTNHPERLDPAILERPSRFDRRYTFAPPAEAERRRYLETWNQRLSADMQMDAAALTMAAAESAGFSYAMLKELMLSAMMLWMDRKPGSMAAVLPEVLAYLRSQTASAAA